MFQCGFNSKIGILILQNLVDFWIYFPGRPGFKVAHGLPGLPLKKVTEIYQAFPEIYTCVYVDENIVSASTTPRWISHYKKTTPPWCIFRCKISG